MANKIVDADMLDNGLTAIADSIRTKTGEEGALAFPDGFVDAIDGIEQSGEMTPTQALQFWANVCYEAGNIRFDETVKTVGDLAFTRAVSISNFLRETKIEQVGVISAPEATTVSYLFCQAQNLQKVGGVVAPKSTRWDGCFSTCRGLVEITNPLDVSAATNLNETFIHCDALKEVRFVAGSIHMSVGFKRSDRLSVASIQSIIDGLADLTGETAQVLTLTSMTKSQMTDEQIATVTGKNWTLA